MSLESSTKRSRADSEVLRFWGRLISGVFVILMLMVWEHVQALRWQRQLVDVQHEVDRLTYENGRMRMQIHQWVSPSHLDSIARSQYGMAPVDAKHRIALTTP